NKSLAYTNVSLFFGGIEGDDLGQHVLSYVQPLGSKLGLGLGYERIGSELMSENGAFLSLSYKLSKAFNLGLSAKYLFWSVGNIPADNGRNDPLSNSSAGNVGVDLGLMWQTPFKGANFGLLLKNLNQPNVASGTVAGDADAGKLPMDVHLGVAYQLNAQSLVSVQFVRSDLSGDSSDNRLLVGGETQLAGDLLLRAGGSKIFEEDATGDLNAGLGYKWNKLLFDYAYHIPLDLTETNGAHRFSFAYDF
ncbi:MAG: type IX secretion system membrane protein PorP/SprF, partial [Candidatus Latescibacteria bacterium]|nr:type IX secretion system membrane protein PorP/SprF [Candidatus Latescibacterota bacterium]